MFKRWVRRVIAPILLGLGSSAVAGPATAVELGPQGVVRQFCQVDAMGKRASGWQWADVAPLVAWSFEPAWDHAVLVTAYAVEAPRPSEAGALAVDVHYNVVGEVSALGLDATAYVETVTFRVYAPDPAGWRIIGPPPAPHIFGNRVDMDQMRRSLEQGRAHFVPNSLFVWRMFRGAGWNVAFERAADLLSGETYRPVDPPAVGDLVVYLRDETPYHVGLLEAENQVVSSTLNAGIVRTTVNAFPGEVKYLRLVEPQPGPPAEVLGGTGSVGVAPAPPRSPAPPARATPTPRPTVKKPQKRRRPAKVRRTAKPSVTKRVKKAKRGAKRRPRTPVATRKVS